MRIEHAGPNEKYMGKLERNLVNEGAYLFVTGSGRLAYNAATLRVHAPPFASQLSLLDGDMMQPGELALRVSPRLCSQLAQDFALRLGPEGPRHRQRSSPFRCEPHRLDPPVGVGSTLEHAVALQEGKAARQGRLVNGELVLQLLQARLT